MKRLSYWVITLILLATGSIGALSCSSPSGQNIETPFPYAFEGIISAGVENAAPVEVELAVDFPKLPDSVPIYLIEPVTENQVIALARRLGFNGVLKKPSVAEAPYIFAEGLDSENRVVSETRTLEIKQDGYLHLRLKETDVGGSAPELPSFDEAAQIAKDWLISNNLYPQNVTSIEKGGGAVGRTFNTETSEMGESIPYSMIIKFKTSLPLDIENYTSGASVAIGKNGTILDVYAHIETIKESGTVKLKDLNVAFNLLKAQLASSLADQNKAKESVINMRAFERLSVTQITLQYIKGKKYIQPIFVFQGNAYSQGNAKVDNFVGKIDAVSR
jgi:hypothetical protein